jgi:hypothetical protein
MGLQSSPGQLFAPNPAPRASLLELLDPRVDCRGSDRRAWKSPRCRSDKLWGILRIRPPRLRENREIARILKKPPGAPNNEG